MHLLSICIQIIQLTLSKYVYIYTHTTKLLQKKKTPIISSKKLLILMPKFLYIYILKFFKTFQNFCYLNFYTFITNYHSSTLTYIIFLLYKSQFFLLIIILIPINKFKYPIGFQQKIHTFIYITFKHYNTKPKKQINK